MPVQVINAGAPQIILQLLAFSFFSACHPRLRVPRWSCTEANDDLSETQFAYLKDLIQSNFAIVMTIANVSALVTHNAHLVALDNADGSRQAMQHLFQHGHRRICIWSIKALQKI